jgi:hypothetical protein
LPPKIKWYVAVQVVEAAGTRPAAGQIQDGCDIAAARKIKRCEEPIVAGENTPEDTAGYRYRSNGRDRGAQHSWFSKDRTQPLGAVHDRIR